MLSVTTLLCGIPAQPSPGVFAPQTDIKMLEEVAQGHFSHPWVSFGGGMGSSLIPGASTTPGQAKNGPGDQLLARLEVQAFGGDIAFSQGWRRQLPNSSPRVELVSPSGQGQCASKGKWPRDLMPQGEENAAERWIPDSSFPEASQDHGQDLGQQQG